MYTNKTTHIYIITYRYVRLDRHILRIFFIIIICIYLVYCSFAIEFPSKLSFHINLVDFCIGKGSCFLELALQTLMDGQVKI